MWLEPRAFSVTLATVIIGRTDPNRNARQSRDLLDAANELRGSEDPLVLFEARCEIRDFDDAALAVLENGFHDGGVAQIGCAGFDLVGQDDVAEPLSRRRPQAAWKTRGRNRSAARTTRRFGLWYRASRRSRQFPISAKSMLRAGIHTITGLRMVDAGEPRPDGGGVDEGPGHVRQDIADRVGLSSERAGPCAKPGVSVTCRRR